MGSRGPRPEPPILKIVRGNPGKRAIDLGAGVNPAVAIPPMPRHLTAAARAEWKRIAPELKDLGLVTALDRAALAIYCTAWGRLVDLELMIFRLRKAAVDAGRDPALALVRQLPSGIVRAHVYVVMAGEEAERVNRLLANFGLSPASRSRVQAAVNQQLGLPGVEDPLREKLAKLRPVARSDD